MRIDAPHRMADRTSGASDTNEKRPAPLREKREDGETEGSCWTVTGLPPRRAALDDRLPAARRVTHPAMPSLGCPTTRPERHGASVSPLLRAVSACAARDASCGALRRPAGLSAALSPPTAVLAKSPVFRLTRRPAAPFPPRACVSLVLPIAICRFPVYPCDTAASRALSRQAAVSVSRPISSHQFLTDNRTAAGTPACPARIGPRCRRTRGAPPCPGERSRCSRSGPDSPQRPSTCRPPPSRSGRRAGR